MDFRAGRLSGGADLATAKAHPDVIKCEFDVLIAAKRFIFAVKRIMAAGALVIRQE